ncbi:hypothetical protein [Lacunimicrobium album]|jgi:outer membrane murein-binding lipoprotein Lpp
MNLDATAQRLTTPLRATMIVAGCLLASCVLTGCQSTVGGQTLPSANYLRDDVQFFPAGSEDLIPNQRRALEEYNAEQKAYRAGTN